MYLKRLELSGFKSFGDKVQLDLLEGLNCVVGPNGSGKSNIADALRWVLGEQSAKQLRGGKMEDIIFNGTAHRKPLGFAEITMRLDNSSGKIPLDFKEITVTRRVYRSGESEFAINGTACRLKDIQMLFMDTGIGRDGYSIVGQGRIDEILSLKSEDRRHVFEEAAGIGKFKSRRNEALRKLEDEKQNLARVDDIIAELEEQMPTLSQQSEEARHFLALRDRYKTTHINIFLNEVAKIETELVKLEETLQNDIIQANENKRLLQEARTASEKLEARAAESDRQYRQTSESLLETTTNIEKKESDDRLLQSQIMQMEQEKIRLQSEITKREASLTERSEEITQEQQGKAETASELAKLNDELSEHIQISTQHDEALKESSAMLAGLNQALLDAIKTSTDASAFVAEEESTYNRLEDDTERLNTEISELETRITETKSTQAAQETTLKNSSSALQKANNSLAAYTKAHDQLIEEGQQLDTQLRQSKENLTATRGRYRALSDLDAQQEGYFRSVKAVLRKKNSGDPNFAGICGAVSELLAVEPEYELAIETALGGSAQNIVAKTEADAKTAIEMLKQTKEGRATFMPLDAVRGRAIPTDKYSAQPGFIGLAAELISCEAAYSTVFDQLLGDVLVVDKLDNALALNKHFGYSQKIVTLTGERLSPGGSITGGAASRQSSRIIGRSRQVQELRQQVEALEAEFARLEAQERAFEAKRQTTDEALNKARETAQSLQLEQQLQTDKLNQAKETMATLGQQMNKYNEENQRLMAAIMAQNQAVRDAKKAVLATEEAINKARQAIEDYQHQMEQSRQEHSEESDILTNLRVEISRRGEWLTQRETNIQRLQKEIETLKKEKSQLQRETINADKTITTATTAQAAVTKEISTLKTSLEEARAAQARAEADKETIETGMTHAKIDERSYADTTALMEKEITRLEMRKEQLNSTSHRLHNEIWEEYSLTYQQAQELKQTDINEHALRREWQELRSELAKLENVNIGAIEAYKQIKTRHDFLTTQRGDIETAEASLNELITSLTRQMETQFNEKFQQIAMHFTDVFREMFGGGNAGLRLLDVDNVLESGIEISAQPPGKALQNLMLLSGGERALTAIALLFAILRMKPSPFCVLDEIESALDDANVVRYANFLKEYAKGTQFIVITHRKGTMEAADRLYGVTMEEQGVSKLVSVSFMKEEELI
ncbi:MAG: chromosome segregation protein SMC [Defluviitaleaceae bacterium]|nr:chromosome segregation protein SMC [Defluviitaleaceae bacterium]